jgi:hypothetical protein
METFPNQTPYLSHNLAVLWYGQRESLDAVGAAFARHSKNIERPQPAQLFVTSADSKGLSDSRTYCGSPSDDPPLKRAAIERRDNGALRNLLIFPLILGDVG